MGSTASVAYYQFLRDFREQSQSELDFHKQKANRALCPRRTDFNVLYRKFCNVIYGGENGKQMFQGLESNLQQLRNTNMARVEWQLYDSVMEIPLIVALVTPLMERVHMVFETFLLFKCIT